MVEPGPRNLITDVRGLRVGNAEDHGVRTGVTVVLADTLSLAVVDVRGGAPGTRDTDALDPTEWTTNPPPPAQAKADWPQLYYNINVSPKIVDDAKEAAALGGEWKQFALPQALVTAAQKQLDAAKSATPPA